MSTKRKGIRGNWALTLALASMCAATAGSAFGGPSLLDMCWSPAEIAGHPHEKPPRRGAPGHRQSIPATRLVTTTPIPLDRQGSIRRVRLPKGQKLVALTFDMCEQPGEVAGYDGGIVDYLRANDMRATFFSGGKWMVTHRERTQQLMADPRFEMGNHGWEHRNVRGLGQARLNDEILGPQRAYEAARSALSARQCVANHPAALRGIAPRLSLYRFPYGACNPEALSTLAASGLLAIQWDVSAGDASKTTTADAVARNVLGSVRPGSIVLFHANGRGYHTADALRQFVPKLRAKGYSFVTVSQLLAAGEPEITPTCYDHRPGDTDRYDRLFAPPRPAALQPTSGFSTEVKRVR